MLRLQALLLVAFALTASVEAKGDGPVADKPGMLFQEGFDDSQLLKRGWYDGDLFAISSSEPQSGKGCLDFTWKDRGTTPANSSGMRRLFEPTETVY